MVEIIIFLLGILIGALCTYFVMINHQSTVPSQGIGASVEKQHFEKQLRKQKILELLKEKGSITNDDIEQPLGISHPTAANYLHELVQEGKIEQIGERGRFVSYQLKK